MDAAASPSPLSWHASEPEAVLRATETENDWGLTALEASTRSTEYGPNVIKRSQGPTALTLVWRQLNNPIVYLLLGSAALAVGLGKALDGLVVLGAAVVNAAIGFLQEFRAGKAIEALSRMVPQDAKVIREGRIRTVPSSELIPGDIVLLASGDRVPADVRLLSQRNFRVEEAVALLVACGAVGLFLWEYRLEVARNGHAVALREAQTMAVTTIVFFQIFYLFNCRSLRSSVFELGFFSNRSVFLGIGALLFVHRISVNWSRGRTRWYG